MGNNDEQEKKGGFKVMDRRRFDSAGDDRDSESTPTHSSQPSKPVEPTQSRSESPQQNVVESTRKAAHDDPEEGITFASFVMSLATQTLMQLGQMKPPGGMEVPVDVDGAKQTIDILAMLERRTRGNLDAEETRMMTEILHSLRMSFVQGVPKR